MDRHQTRQLALAGTVTFPEMVPATAELSVEVDRCHSAFRSASKQAHLLVTERPSPRVTIRRQVALQDVRAVFVPSPNGPFSFEEGAWLVGQDVAAGIRALKLHYGGPPRGIAYVHEQAATLLTMETGLTAGEAAQYYPPLPSDRSRNHYSGVQSSPQRRTLCEDPIDYMMSDMPFCEDMGGPAFESFRSQGQQDDPSETLRKRSDGRGPSDDSVEQTPYPAR